MWAYCHELLTTCGIIKTYCPLLFSNKILLNLDKSCVLYISNESLQVEAWKPFPQATSIKMHPYCWQHDYQLHQYINANNPRDAFYKDAHLNIFYQKMIIFLEGTIYHVDSIELLNTDISKVLECKLPARELLLMWWQSDQTQVKLHIVHKFQPLIILNYFPK